MKVVRRQVERVGVSEQSREAAGDRGPILFADADVDGRARGRFDLCHELFPKGGCLPRIDED